MLSRKSTKSMTKEEQNNIELTRLVMNEAADLATIIHKHIVKRKKIHQFGMTVVGYAVEMMLSNAAESVNMDYDQMSKDWREFMVHAHDDIKKLQANKPKGDA